MTLYLVFHDKRYFSSIDYKIQEPQEPQGATTPFNCYTPLRADVSLSWYVIICTFLTY